MQNAMIIREKGAQREKKPEERGKSEVEPDFYSPDMATKGLQMRVS